MYFLTRQGFFMLELQRHNENNATHKENQLIAFFKKKTIVYYMHVMRRGKLKYVMVMETETGHGQGRYYIVCQNGLEKLLHQN